VHFSAFVNDCLETQSFRPRVSNPSAYPCDCCNKPASRSPECLSLSMGPAFDREGMDTHPHIELRAFIREAGGHVLQSMPRQKFDPYSGGRPRGTGRPRLSRLPNDL
jgi:hypothetical protein